MNQICDMPCAGLGSEPRNEVGRRIGGIGWGLFFLWVGASLLFDVGWGVGLLGIGILTLAMQVVRRRIGLRPEGFWVIVGSAFALAGVWEVATIQVALGPILLMALGVVVLASAAGAGLGRSKSEREPDQDPT